METTYFEWKVFSDGASVDGSGKQNGQLLLLLLGVIGHAEIRFCTQ